ncbi:MAG: amidase [Methylobacteriaceae bacterium]|nr:amidase [Methylobacteriaceae bacterium]
MTDLLSLDGAAVAALFAKRAVSPVELLAATLARLDRDNPRVNALNIVDRDGALAAARASEQRWAKGAPLSPCDGLIATIKDNIMLAGFPNRRGSPTTDPAPVGEDAPAPARLKEAGCVILGKTTLPEYGWKGLCDSPLTGITRNPWKLSQTTGGSSGGAAAVAALGVGHFHLGTDGAGSIRIPSAFTGLVGLKPSFGRVPAAPASPFGVVAHLGPMARRVADAAAMLTILSRPDARDNLAWNTAPPDYRIGLDDGVAGLRIAFSPRLGFSGPIDPDVAAATAAAAEVFAGLGAHVEEASPDLGDPFWILDTLWKAGAAAATAAVPDSAHAQMDPGLVREFMAGRKLSATDYLKAFSARAGLAFTMAEFHRRYDLMLTPQMPTGAIEAGRDTPADGAYGQDWIGWSPFTWPFNLTQQPAASVPSGLTREGLPIGLQIVGPMRADALVLRAARAFESARPLPRLDAPRP